MTFEMSPTGNQLGGVLDTTAGAFTDWRPLLLRFLPHIADGLAANIDSRGATLDDPWPAPNPEYAERKALDGFPATPLVMTGALVADVKAARVLFMDENSLGVGIKEAEHPQAFALNFGAGVTPRHAFMGWNRRMIAGANAEIERYANETLDNAARRLGG